MANRTYAPPRALVVGILQNKPSGSMLRKARTATPYFFIYIYKKINLFFLYKDSYSVVRASTGFSLAAWDAGLNPKMIPIPTEKPNATKHAPT